MSSQAFYKEHQVTTTTTSTTNQQQRPFDPKSKHAYEENLSKFKDERDAIQKKTFTKWVNKHLKKAQRQVTDLFTDLQDGLNLISLLEVLTGEQLHREKGRMRFHMLQNVELVLNFLRFKKIKLVNIRPEDIVDGNPKLTLGLIWTIILHFQISDIVVGEEPNVSARDVLLRWAKKSTAKYPGVRVGDFTQSWRDGLAFNAIIHRNRPDLIDWRTVRTKTVRERLENAFYTAEKVGVTRLLDPEDVDTHEIDEKSIITYVSSLYDIFPEPPPNHPLYDSECQTLVHEYREVASSLHLWMRERISQFSSPLPNSLHDLKRSSHDSARFKTEEVPIRQRDKQKIHHIYRDLQKYFEAVGEVEIEPELHVDLMERNWKKLMTIHQDRDITIQEEIKKYERLERLAEKVQREVKRVDGRLDDLETKIQEESRRVDRLHPLDAKHNVDLLESELRAVEELIQGLFQDVQALKSGNHPLSADLHKRVNKLHQRWVSLRTMLHSKLIVRLASVSFPVVEERTVTKHTRTVLETRLVDTNTHFRALQQAIDYCNNKLKQLEESDYGTDLHSAKSELSYHQREHKEIDKFQSKVDHCVAAKANFHGEELALYIQHLTTLQKLYAELLSLSNKRMSDLESLLDLLQSVSNQMSWLVDKQQIEIARDWTDKDLNLHQVNSYYQSLLSELEKREVSVRSVVERGQSLILQGHPGSKTIESAVEGLKSNWAHLVQLTLALEIHLKTVTHYRQFYQDLNDVEAWINSRDEILNTTYSVVEFGLDEGERLLKGMQELREELNSRSGVIQELQERAQTVAPIRQRRSPVVRPINVRAVCDYKQQNMSIEKGDTWLLHDNSALTKWRVSEHSGSNDVNIPGAVFLIPPPCRESIEAANRLASHYESTLSLWQRKQLRMRQNMIFATIKVVRSWDLAQFVAMGSDQRNAIRRALNEDADKLLAEGDPSDPQLRRLRLEMDEVNRLFDEFERLARQEEETKSIVRQWNEVMSSLQINLDEFERTLNNRLTSHIPRDIHSLEHMVIQHKEFETSLKALTPDIENAQAIFRNIPRKTPQLQNTLDNALKQWNQLWNSSHIYIERLKCVEILLNALDEANNVVSDLEIKLASFGDMPSELEPLQKAHDDLVRVQNSIAAQQPLIDQLIEDATNTRRVVVRSRDRLKHDHADLDRIDDDVNSITTRWNNLCASLVDRLRSCEAAYSLLENYGKTYQTEVKYIDESYTQLNNLPPVSHSKHHIEPTRVLFTSIVERTQPLEQVNIDGGRFIREAKIYNLRLRRFNEEVEKWQPSLDASATRIEPNRGEEDVAKELDRLNHRFLALCAILQDRLKQLALDTGDKQLMELVMANERTQLRTFRTEFSLFESSIDPRSSSALSSNGDVVDMGNKMNGESRETLSYMRERRVEEGIGTGLIHDLVGIVDPKTGQKLSVGEAIRRRILDVRTGKIQGVGVTEAVERGYVDRELADKLLGPCGEMTLLEAIQKELLEAERGPAHRVKVSDSKWVRDIFPTCISLSDALAQNLIDSEGLVLDRLTGERCSVREAIGKRILDGSLREIVFDNSKITLSEAIDHGVIDQNYEVTTGPIKIVDAWKLGFIAKPVTLKDLVESKNYVDRKITNRAIKGSFSIKEAMERGILDGKNLQCIASGGCLITLDEALDKKVILNDGCYVDNESDKLLDIETAVKQGMIFSVHNKSIFDIDAFLDEETNEFVSLNEALMKNIVDKNGEFVYDRKSKQSMSVERASKEGLVRGEIFEKLNQKIGIMSGGKELSVYEAVIKEYLSPKTGFVLEKRKKPVHLNEALDRKLITLDGVSLLLSLLNITVTTQQIEKITIREVPKLSIKFEEAVRIGLVDVNTQTYTEPESGKTMPVEEAVKEGLLVVTKEKKSPIREVIKMAKDLVRSKGSIEIPDEGMYLSKAIELGLLDPTSGMFSIHDTDRLVSFEECIKLGIISSDSARVIDVKKRREMGLSRALDKALLDCTGHYGEEKITLGNAIEKGLIVLKEPPVRQAITLGENEPVQTSPGVIFEPASGLVISTDTGEAMPLLNAIVEGKVRNDSVRVKHNGEEMGLKEALEMGIVDLGKGEVKGQKFLDAAKLGAIVVVGAPLIAAKSAVGMIKKALVKDPTTGEEISINEAFERGVVDSEILKKCEESVNSATPSKVMSSRSISLEDDVPPSLAEMTRSRVTTEPKFRVKLGSGKLVPPVVGKPVILQKIKKKIVPVDSAKNMGIVDEETANILSVPDNFSKDGEVLSLNEAINMGLIDPSKGSIKDLHSSETLTIGEALERGILDPDDTSGNILIPVGRSLTIPELVEQGLVVDNSIIHPETGERLSLADAISCEIVDPRSTIVTGGRELTLREAISEGIIDPTNSTVNLGGKSLKLVDCVGQNAFPEKERCSIVPPLGVTLAVAVESGLLDVVDNTLVNPVTGEKQSILDALDKNLIMAVPVNSLPDAVQLSDALEQGLIKDGNYIDAKTNESVPLKDALAKGMLIVKPASNDEHVVSVLTETIRKIETVQTYLIEPGYELQDNVVTDVLSGEKIPLESALKKGIVKEAKRPVSYAEAIDKGFVDFEKGVYCNPESGIVMAIEDAIKSGFLDNSGLKTGKKESLDIGEAIETLYDEKAGKFTNPKDGRLLDLKGAVEEGIINPDSVVYDAKTGRPISAKEALNQGIIDKSGKVKDKSGKSISLKEATKIGLLAVVGAPILAGKAVVDAVRTLKRQKSKEQSVESQPSFESIKGVPLKEVITSGTVKPEETKITLKIAGEDKSFTIRDALDKGLISLNSKVNVDEEGVTFPKEKFRMEVSKGLSAKDLALIGAYNVKEGKFLNPKTNKAIGFDDWLETCGILDPDSLLVKDVNTHEYIPIKRALEEGNLIDEVDGSIRDPRTQKEVPFFEALKLGWIVSRESKKRGKLLLSLNEALEKNLLDPIKCEVSSPLSDKKYTICEAVVENILDPDQISVRHPMDDQLIPLTDSVEMGIVNLNKGIFINPSTGTENGFDQAFLAGFVRPCTRPISLKAVIEKGLYCPKNCTITDIITKQEVDVPESVKRGIVDPFISECKNVKENTVQPLNLALENKIIDKGKFKNTKTNKNLTLDNAVQEGLITTKDLTLSLIDTISLGYYSPKNRNFLDPRTGDIVCLEDCIKSNFINPNLTKIKDPRNDKLIPTEEAIAAGLVDDKKNVLTYPFIMSLDVAFAKGYILPSVKPFTLSEALVHGFYNPNNNLFVIDGTSYTLKECIEKDIINGDSPTIRDPISGDILSLVDAIKSGLIDANDAKVKDKNGVPVNLFDALERGLLVPAKRRFSLPEAVFKGLYDLKTGKVINPSTKERMEIDRAIDKGVIDPASTIVKLEPGRALTFEHAVEEGIVEPKSGTIKVGDHQINFQEAFETGVLVEAHRPMPLREAILKGVYCDKTGLFLDPRSGDYLNLSIALESNLIDPDSVHVKDTKKGFWNKMSLKDAICNALVDGQTSRVRDFTNGTELTLLQAFDAGLIVDTTTSVSLQRTIHQGLYDDKTGKFCDPKTGAKITLHEAIRRFIINPLLPCYWDKSEEKLLSVLETCKLGIIDRRLGSFRDPRCNYYINLATAMDLGLIVDIETAGFGLHQCLSMGLYDKDKRIFTHPVSDQKVNLSEAISIDLINPYLSIIKDHGSGEYMNLTEAIERGIINSLEGVYIFKETGDKIDLIEAKKRCLIVSSKRGLDLKQVVSMGLYDREKNKIIDPKNNKTLSLTEAMENEFVSPETTGVKDSNGQLKSLVTAIHEGIVDSENCTVMDPVVGSHVKLDVGFENNILVNLDMPLTFQETVRKSSADFEKALFRERVVNDSSLEDNIKYGLIDPDAAVVKNPKTGKFTPLIEAVQLGFIEMNKKVTFPTQVSKVSPQCCHLDQGNTIYMKEPLTFSDALDKDLIDLKTGQVKVGDDLISLNEAFTLGLIDPDSVVVKDTLKRRLYRLPEAIKKGIVDDRGNILDTANSKLFNIKEGLKNGVLCMNKLSLIDTLDYGVYNPTTGSFTDPFCTAGGVTDRRRLNLSEAIQFNLVDPSTTVLRDPNSGNITSIGQAIDSKTLDPISGRLLDPLSQKSIDLVKAKDKGFIIAAESRQAMEEKYKLCDDTLKQLLEWITEVEDRLVKQDLVQEDLDQLRNQINILKLIKEEIESQARMVSNCLDQVRVVVSTGAEYLSRDEVNGLERNGKQLRTRYDRASDKTEKLLRRLIAAADELSKFMTEIEVFNKWMDKARRGLEDREKALGQLNPVDTREFVSDVIAHQADLRFITMAAHKFFHESKEYLVKLNEYRSSLTSRLPLVEPPNESFVRNLVSRTSDDYRDLLSRANQLADKLSGVGGRQKEYNLAVDRLRQWLNQAEPRANKMIGEAVAADPHSIEDQLNRAKALHNEFLSQGRLVDNLKQSLESLVRSLEGNISPSEINQLESPVRDLTDKYNRLCNQLSDKVSQLDTALLQSQGVEESLDSITQWITSTENSLKLMSKPASLHKERLEEQIREVRLLISDIDSHRGSLGSISEQAKTILQQTANPRLAKRIETKYKDVISRFEKLVERSSKRLEMLNETNELLSQFLTEGNELERWATDLTESVGNQGGSADDAARQRDMNRERFERVLRDGKALVAKKDVTDTTSVRDKIKSLESAWRELNSILDEKQRLGKAKEEQKDAYDKLKEQVLIWLNNMEARVSRLEPVAVHSDVLKRQADDIKPLLKEHRDYNMNIEKLFDAGNSLDNLLRPDTSSLRRRISVSPTKKTSLTQIGRRPSGDGSPTKLLINSTTVYTSRRMSQDGEISVIQQELHDIHSRYTTVGSKLTDRQSEIETTREEVRRATDSLKTLDAFLDKLSRNMPREGGLPSNKQEADAVNKVIKGILEEMYEKQSLLESTKNTINELLRKKPTAIGADALRDQLADITVRWKNLNDTCKSRIKLLDDLKEVHDTYENLNSWLVAKDKMFNALGPISSDPRMVQSQIQQVQVLRDELRTQHPSLVHFSSLAESVLSQVPESPDTARLRSKVSTLSSKYEDLSERLDARAAALGAAVDSSRELGAALSRLRDTMQAISDQLDQIPRDSEPQQQLSKIQGCERQLEGVRGLLSDAEVTAEELCRVLTDSATRAEIQGKLSGVNRQYNSLQAKIDQRKAEIEGLLRDGREFEEACARTIGWLSDGFGSLSERLLISADKDLLQQQHDIHEPIYKEVISKEHEVIMLLDKGREKGDVRQLETIRSQWDKLKKEVVDRQTRLQIALEQCKKYYKALEAFIPWLSQAENKLDALRPDSFSKKDIEKHLRDLANFRNDVWKKSGEFEHMRSLGESFLQSCDIDKEIVKQELSTVKQRWDKLNNDVFSRTGLIEDLIRRLGDVTDKLRDLNHSVQRCEDKLANHDAVGASDPASLARLNGVREETAGLGKPLDSLLEAALDLDHEAALIPARSSLGDDVQALRERLDDLQARLDDRCSLMHSAQAAILQFNEKLKGVTMDLSSLESEFDSMKPPGRDIKTVRQQQDQIHAFISKLGNVGDDVRSLLESADSLVDCGYSADAAATRKQASLAAKTLSSLEERSRARQDELDATMDKLNNFQTLFNIASDNIDNAVDELKHLKPIGSEVETIKSQQEEFARLRGDLLEPVTRSVDQVNRSGQSLIQTAAGGVSTSQIEKDIENINNKYNSLKEKVNERGRKLDSGLLHSGKFQEALEGLNKWLTDTEEMVANQRPPSADYKVVKAQLQEQKFLKKMLTDRQGSVSGLFEMGREVAENADPAERAHIEGQIEDLVTRFDNLTDGAQKRMEALERAMSVAKHFQDKLNPVLEWLDRTEKKIKDMELVPTDEEKIQNQIREHNALHNEILRKKPALSELTEVGSQLMSLVGEDEASNVADRVQETADRYSNLVDASDSVGQLLEASRAGLRHLVLSYQQLQAWMEGMEQRLNRYKVLAVHTDKLLAQMDDLADLTEEVSNRQGDIDGTVDSGLELMKHISNDEAIQLKDKLDSLQRRYNQLTSRGADLLRQAQEALPLVQQFHNAHTRLVDWMMGAESQLQAAEPREEDIHRLELDIQEFRPVVENINQVGPQLCSLSPGEGASTIEGLVTRDNRRFDSIVEQIQRKAERLHLSKQRSLEVLGDIDALLEWFREVEAQLREAELPSSDPRVIRLQLKEHKALNDDISSQKGRVRDVLATAKKVLRETRLEDDASLMRDKMSDLRETMDSVWSMSGDRLGVLEQALGLATHLLDSHSDLASWLTEIEQHVEQLPLPAIRPQAIAQQQDRTQMLLQSISEHKPLVDKLNKTGEALIRLVVEEEGAKVQEMLDSDNARYAALRAALKKRQDTLDKALQESSQFSDKLEGMLRTLANTADEVASAEPVSAHPPKIKQQQNENQALIDDLNKRQEAFDAVKRAAEDVISKAPNSSDPAVKDVRKKLDRLSSLWNEVQDATRKRGKSLDEAYAIAAKFWTELQSVMATLADLEASLASQQPPAARPQAIERQQRELQEIKAEIEQTKPEVEQVRKTGHSLMALCGEPDKPEVKKHIEDLDSAWDNVTALFAKREENLINAMEKAMEFHETLTDLLEFLKKAEDKFAKLGPLGSDIETVKKQIGELKDFKSAVDPYMVKVEALNRQAQDLTERTSADQAAGLKESLQGVNSRWDELHRGIAERARQLEHSLLRLGQFQHALDELMAWIQATNTTLERDIKLVVGDSHLLEIELAKLKVLLNDIQAHQSSVDTLNDAGRQLIESGRGTREASTTQDKLNSLNRSWKDLMHKATSKHRELEEALQEAHRFGAEMQDLLSWLSEVDSVITSSKPVGGLPETASEQLERFMELYREVESARPKVESILAQGQDYLKRSPNTSGQLGTNLKTLKQRWDSVLARANDKKIKLEIALKEATEFHQALQAFVDWLTSAEKNLSSLKPVSRVLETIRDQIEEHKGFQKEVGMHRETMIQLDKKGTHLKYFSQKQDVILIKNLLISVQHRWERVVSKSAERTRALDHGYKEAKEFHDAWCSLMNWLNETESMLDEVNDEIASAANDPVKLKQRLAKHRETQKALAAKQPQYDATLRAGKTIRERAPKSDENALKTMVAQLKEKWNAVCAKAVDRQRKLEEALLYCGQFKDALEALMDWLRKTNKNLTENTLVHGDLDTVHSLIDQHKALEKEMSERGKQMASVEKTGSELASKAGHNAESQALLSQLSQLTSLWRETTRLVETRGSALQQALIQAEELHKSVHMLLEWLSDAEMKLRFVDSLPDDELETANQISIHEKFMREMTEKERDKDSTISLAERILAKAHPDATSVIKHWITIIESRWEEVASWALNRKQKLQAHLKVLNDLDNLLEELLEWLARIENDLLEKERQELPKEIPVLQELITEHHHYMEDIMTRQGEVDAVCKAKQVKPVEKDRKGSTASKKLSTPSKDDLRQSSSNLVEISRRQSLKSSRDNLGTLDRRTSRASPGRDVVDSGLTPHFGPRFPAKGSKAAEPQFRSPRARLLWDRWRNVWLLAWERQRRLQQGLNHLEELERLANFSWDDWRKRFLKFMNHKKARITDLMRKMDRNNDNLIPRDDFIDGIIKTKFESSKLEMGAVADMFDHNSEGVIDWKEFIAALRPDWEERQPSTEAEKIHDEVKRLVMLCTCRQKFRVYQVGEGKYRFGDSQKLRLVRILRSTVMVRVGGGWVALEEFLVKNDPCRAKGRTNIELREQFILADGVSQSMSAFKPKSSTSSRPSISSQGPITKVKEKTSRSVPMAKTSSASSRGMATPGSVDSLSDTEGSPAYSTPYRKPAFRSSLTQGGSLPGSRNSSRPASRQGSKPPSIHGSSLSLASSDDGTPSRIPRRSTPSGGRTATTPTSRKLTAPALNGTKSPSSPSTTKSQIPRASSIPTLVGLEHRSKIPVYVGSSSGAGSPVNDSLPSSCSSSSGARTPSTSSAKVTRKGSTASDTQRKTPTERTPTEKTPTDPRAPFRL